MVIRRSVWSIAWIVTVSVIGAVMFLVADWAITIVLTNPAAAMPLEIAFQFIAPPLRSGSSAIRTSA
jgi:hypothetical protein